MSSIAIAPELEARRVLYHTPLSPFCRKIRLLLKEKQLDFTLVEEPVWEKRQDFFKLNPAGEVPVMVDQSGLVISGSYAIGEYLEEAYADQCSLGKSFADRAEVRRLVTWFDVKFYQEVSQPILFEKVFRRMMDYGAPDSEAIRYAKRNLLYHLDYIGHLTGERTWIAGDTISMADFAAAAHLSVLDYLGDVAWENADRAKEWYAVIKSRPTFRPLLADRVSGFRPPSHYDDLDF